MKTHIISVGSVTYAIKLRKTLLKHNISSKLVKNTSNDGCIYALEIDGRDYFEVAKVLRENDLYYPITEK